MAVPPPHTHTNTHTHAHHMVTCFTDKRLHFHPCGLWQIRTETEDRNAWKYGIQGDLNHTNSHWGNYFPSWETFCPHFHVCIREKITFEFWESYVWKTSFCIRTDKLWLLFEQGGVNEWISMVTVVAGDAPDVTATRRPAGPCWASSSQGCSSLMVRPNTRRLQCHEGGAALVPLWSPICAFYLHCFPCRDPAGRATSRCTGMAKQTFLIFPLSCYFSFAINDTVLLDLGWRKLYNGCVDLRVLCSAKTQVF